MTSQMAAIESRLKTAGLAVSLHPLNLCWDLKTQTLQVCRGILMRRNATGHVEYWSDFQSQPNMFPLKALRKVASWCN